MITITPYRVEVACKTWWPTHWPKQFDKKDAESIRNHMREALQAAVDAPSIEPRWDQIGPMPIDPVLEDKLFRIKFMD